MYNLSENSEDTEMYRFIQFREVIFSLFEVFLKTPVFSKNGMAHWLQMVSAVKGLNRSAIYLRNTFYFLG